MQELTQIQLSKHRGQHQFVQSQSATHAREPELIGIREEKRAIDEEKSAVLAQVRVWRCSVDIVNI